MKNSLPAIIDNASKLNKTNKQKRYFCYKATAESMGYKMRQKLPETIELAIKNTFPDITNSYVMYKES
jgi:hypothetical protein